MEQVVKRFHELELQELYDILRVRTNVFVVEQRCPYPELDNKDQHSYHVYLRNGEGIQAYLRVIDPGISFREASIGRVLTVKRGCGYGRILLREGIRVAKEKLGASRIRIEAQVYAKEFYEKEGFVQCSEEFMEDGIPHIQMLWEIQEQSGWNT